MSQSAGLQTEQERRQSCEPTVGSGSGNSSGNGSGSGNGNDITALNAEFHLYFLCRHLLRRFCLRLRLGLKDCVMLSNHLHQDMAFRLSQLDIMSLVDMCYKKHDCNW